MKLLVSAYACEPGKGSEPGVGWNWVRALVRRGYDVHVITRSNNRENIERVPAARQPGLTFHYHDLSASARRWKQRRGGIYLYYLLWQWGAYRLAKRLHARERFDRVHHVTFVSYRQPSFMGRLGIPFIFGPIGGGETMPGRLLRTLSFRGRISEAIRNLGSKFIALDPMMHSAFARAEIIACTTAETVARIPRRYRAKCVVQLAIGIDEAEILGAPCEPPRSPRLLFVGRLLYWKGLHLAFPALAQARGAIPDLKMKIVGSGEDRAWLESEACSAGVMDLLEWVPSTPHEEIVREYRESVCLVFPSLHDSGGMVVLEALAAGLPVICLDLGGPGTIATPACALIVPARQFAPEDIVRGLANAMIRMVRDEQFRARLCANAAHRAQELTWDRAVENLYGRIDPSSAG